MFRWHPSTSRKRAANFLAALLAGATLASAQLPVARLAHLFPPGGKAGTTAEVTAAGADLDEPVRLHFSNAGITATPKGDANKFAVTVASNVPPGVYEARFVGRFGISNPRAFVVGTLPESIAPTTNTTTATALALPLDTTLHGRSQPNTVAWFKLSAKKTQRLLIECLAESIDSRMDAALVLTDAAGRELERNRTGGILDFIAPADGSYLLKVSDFLYRGGDDYFYRLTAATGPRLDFVFPPAGVPGTKTNYTLYGRNLPGSKPAKDITLDGKPLDQITVTIEIPANDRTRQRLSTGLLVRPAAAAMDGFEYRLNTPKGLSNPILLGFATAAVVLEQEPNDPPAQAQKIVPPCEVAGHFLQANEQDWFSFEAKKGDVFWIEVFSQRLGLQTDPFLLVQRVTKNDKGEESIADVQEVYDNDANLGGGEFNTASRDPIIRFEAKETGTHRVMVRDLFQHPERSARFVYRLSLRREAPDFRLVAQSLVPRYKADAKNIDLGIPLLRRGETIALRVMAFRRDGFKGAIELSLENPPPGLLFEGDRIEGGKDSDFILLTAATNAPAFAGPIKLLGKAKVGDTELVREARGGTMLFPVGNTDSERPESRLSRALTLAISDQESAPVSITSPGKKVWEVPEKGKVEIPLAITRRGEFNNAFKLKPLGPGVAEALKEFDVDAKATNVTLKLDLAALKLVPGDYSFAVQTMTAGKYRNNPEAAALAEASVKEADKLAKELAESAKAAAAEFDKSTKAATEAEAAAKAAAEKLATAKVSLEKAGTDAKLLAERDAAAQAATDATAKAKAATEGKATAEKAKVAAEGRVKEVQAKKEAATARAKAANDKAKARDVTVQVHSTPIAVKVLPAPAAEAKAAKEPEKAKTK